MKNSLQHIPLVLSVAVFFYLGTVVCSFFGAFLLIDTTLIDSYLGGFGSSYATRIFGLAFGVIGYALYKRTEESKRFQKVFWAVLVVLFLLPVQFQKERTVFIYEPDHEEIPIEENGTNQSAHTTPASAPR